MPITWPNTLVAEVAERRCMIALGAGASATCIGADGQTRPPTWEHLLLDASGMIHDAATQQYADGLIRQERAYLDAAEIIWRTVNRPDLSQFLRGTFLTPGFTESDIHRHVLHLDPKVVITTNFDDIYETYCRRGNADNAYNVCRYYQAHLLNDLRSTTRVIIKAHGCISDPTRIVLTRTQYFKARQQYPAFYSILDSLFLVNTLLFIGCSMSDPDLQLLLENANIRVASDHPHYAVVEAGRHIAEVAAAADVHNVSLLEYTRGQHNEVVDALGDLVHQVDDFRSTHS